MENLLEEFVFEIKYNILGGVNTNILIFVFKYILITIYYLWHFLT